MNDIECTHPLSSTSWTVLLVSLKLKHLFTFIPNLPRNNTFSYVTWADMVDRRLNKLMYRVTSPLDSYVLLT